MKKIFSLLLMLTLSIAIHAQHNVTKFLGIPVDGTKASMIEKLKAKGFTYHPDNDGGYLKGEFNGRSSMIFIVTNKRKVWRIYVGNEQSIDAQQAKSQYNRLCEQFENNEKYKVLSSQQIPEKEDIWYEMNINKKSYEAYFTQLPLDNDLQNRIVWIKLIDNDGRYRIGIFYDNGFNQAQGDDL